MYREYQFFTSNSMDQKYVTFPMRGNVYCWAYKLHEVCIPLAFNTTDSSNNAVVFERNGSMKTAVLPTGNHNAATFPGALQKSLNDASTNKDFVVTFDEVSRKLTISADTAFTIHPFADGTTAFRQLGMSKYAPSSTGTSITFGIADFTSTSPILLTSSHLTSKDVTFVSQNNINVLAMIDVASPQNSVCRWVNHAGNYIVVDSNLAQVDFTLLNASTLRPIELDQPYSVLLSILDDEDDPITYT